MSAPVLIMAGGTGGHIFPALAVAKVLQARGIPVIWLGSKGGMESRLVPEHGIPLEQIYIQGVRGKGLKSLLLAPFKLVRALAQAITVIRQHQPRAILGMGGFVAGPGGLAAWLLRKRLIIHEQNSIPGMTNRVLAKFADHVLEGYPQAFTRYGKGLVTEHVGNPVRDDISILPETALRMQGRSGPLRVLVFGGSLGAMTLNSVVPQALAEIGQPLEIRHQCGEKHEAKTVAAYAQAGLSVQPERFIKDMAQAYGWADVVISRAGALSVAEIAQVGVASLLVPYPYAVDDHQTANALHLVALKGAVMMQDSEVTKENLISTLKPMLKDRKTLLEMGARAHALAKPAAAVRVADVCLGESLVETLETPSEKGAPQ